MVAYARPRVEMCKALVFRVHTAILAVDWRFWTCSRIVYVLCPSPNQRRSKEESSRELDKETDTDANQGFIVHD